MIEGVAGTAFGDVSNVVVSLFTPDGLTELGSPDANATTGAFTLPISAALPDGPQSVTVTQTDAAGNTKFQNRQFIVDGTVPAPTLAAQGGEAPTLTGVAGTATGDASRVSVEVFSGDSATGTAVNTIDVPRDATTGAYSAAPSGLSPGAYTARTRQVDDVGNAGSSTPAQFTVPSPPVTAAPVTDPPVSDPPVTDPPAKPPVVTDDTAPALSRVSLSRARWRAGATSPVLRFKLSEAAAITITVWRQGPKTRLGALTAKAIAGANALRFSGRVKGKRLRAGSYVMALVATDAAGNRSTSKSARFRILR